MAEQMIHDGNASADDNDPEALSEERSNVSKAGGETGTP